MAPPKFLNANNAASTTVGGLSSVETSVVLAAGGGARFPVIAEDDEYFMGTFTDSTGALTEIVKVTGRVGDVLVVERAQEGTLGLVWPTGTRFEQKWTAAQAQALLQTALALVTVDVEFADGDPEVQINLSDYDGLPFLFVRMGATEAKTLTNIVGLTRDATWVVLQVLNGSSAIGIELGAPFYLANAFGDVGWPGYPGSTITLMSVPGEATFKLVETARTQRVS